MGEAFGNPDQFELSCGIEGFQMKTSPFAEVG